MNMNECIRKPRKQETAVPFPSVQHDTLQHGHAVPQNTMDEVPPTVQEVLSSNGQSLVADQPFMNPHSGHNFRQIAIHAAAAEVIQTKLAVNQPGDTYEQEANQLAERVMRMPESEAMQGVGISIQPDIQRLHAEHETVHRQPSEEDEGAETAESLEEEAEEESGSEPTEEEKEETLQAKESPGHTPTVTPELQTRIHSLRGGGQPLDAATRAYMEPRFGHDFSQVRIHADAQAAETVRAVNALAYTVGRDVVFGAGQYAPGTNEGRKLLAHELTHVVQQKHNLLDRDTIDRVPLPPPIPGSPSISTRLSRVQLIQYANELYQKSATAYLKQMRKIMTEAKMRALIQRQFKRTNTVAVLQGSWKGRLVTLINAKNPFLAPFIKPLLKPGEIYIESPAFRQHHQRTGEPLVSESGFVTPDAEQTVGAAAKVDMKLTDTKVASSNLGCEYCESVLKEYDIKHVNLKSARQAQREAEKQARQAQKQAAKQAGKAPKPPKTTTKAPTTPAAPAKAMPETPPTTPTESHETTARGPTPPTATAKPVPGSKTPTASMTPSKGIPAKVAVGVGASLAITKAQIAQDWIARYQFLTQEIPRISSTVGMDFYKLHGGKKYTAMGGWSGQKWDVWSPPKSSALQAWLSQHIHTWQGFDNFIQEAHKDGGLKLDEHNHFVFVYGVDNWGKEKIEDVNTGILNFMEHLRQQDILRIKTMRGAHYRELRFKTSVAQSKRNVYRRGLGTLCKGKDLPDDARFFQIGGPIRPWQHLFRSYVVVEGANAKTVEALSGQQGLIHIDEIEFLEK